MLEIINKVKRKDLESLLENQGQNKVGEAMILFEQQVPEMKTIEDQKKFLKERRFQDVQILDLPFLLF